MRRTNRSHLFHRFQHPQRPSWLGLLPGRELANPRSPNPRSPIPCPWSHAGRGCSPVASWPMPFPKRRSLSANITVNGKGVVDPDHQWRQRSGLTTPFPFTVILVDNSCSLIASRQFPFPEPEIADSCSPRRSSPIPYPSHPGCSRSVSRAS